MSLSLAERLNPERHRRFVGRKRELDLFESVLAKLAAGIALLGEITIPFMRKKIPV